MWETLKLCNRVANHVSRAAFDTGIIGKQPLQRLTYAGIKKLGVSAQPALHCIRKAAGAYTTLRANLAAGNYGPAGSKRRERVEAEPIRFRKDAAQPFDDRCLSWQLDARTVSIWTVNGRVKDISFACSPQQAKMLTDYRCGESDLVYRGGHWYLYATCEVPEAEPITPAGGFLGVDLGIANIATTSDGARYAGKHLHQVRHRNRRIRQRLQRKGTKSAKRLLRKVSGREKRFAADTNHRVFQDDRDRGSTHLARYRPRRPGRHP
ncbi:transposase [Nocardia pseudovaccinii]|uniref:transposase n=1 Tax=Nocardia pseudovaccinii TaxID=189540 RepID=UPI003D8E917F